jgi:hypothetical protein
MKIVGYGTVMFVFLCILSPPAVSHAGEADVIAVKAAKGNNGTWSFSVTVKHDDEGWDHYAKQWEVLGPDGEVFGTRVLLHPHVGEQPFTRSLGGVQIPEGLGKVVVRARDSVRLFPGLDLRLSCY